MLASLLWLLLGGLAGGQLAGRLGAPPLLGMMITGLILGPTGLDQLGPDLLAAGDGIRTVAVAVILMRAGLGLDRQKLAQQGSVALRLGVLPAFFEALVVAGLAVWLFDFNWLTGLLLGCVLSAESPAVIVPGMLRLKQLGWGVAKGIPDAIMTGSAFSDVLILLVFGLLLNLLGDGGEGAGNGWLLPGRVLLEITLGLGVGYGVARLLSWGGRWLRTTTQLAVVGFGTSLLLVVLASAWPFFSGYLAVMALGFFLTWFQPPMSRRLRLIFGQLWAIAELALFVLMGATISLSVLGEVLLPGLLLLTVGLAVGRMIGWVLSTWGSDWTWRERFFLLPGNMAKATVQAAIGAIPLAQGVAGGEIILALAALSILVTAPLGAWLTAFSAPRLLQKGDVDPTQVSGTLTPLLLTVIQDPSDENQEKQDLDKKALLTAAAIARRQQGEVVVLRLPPEAPGQQTDPRDGLALGPFLRDIPHRQVTGEPLPAIAQITQVAQQTGASEILLSQSLRHLLLELVAVSAQAVTMPPPPDGQ